jgi:hypothetical protein
MNKQEARVKAQTQYAYYIKGTFEWMDKNIGESLLSGNENDWTCIVTMHAMIETGLSGALAKEFQSPELLRVIERLAMSNTATGKIAFAKALKILEPETIAFVRKLSELRNLCVHDVRNFKFDLNKHVAGLSKKKRNELMNPILKMVNPEARTKITPAEALYAGTFCVMGELYLHDLNCQNRDKDAKIRELQAKIFKEMEKRGSA